MSIVLNFCPPRDLGSSLVTASTWNHGGTQASFPVNGKAPRFVETISLRGENTVD